jgi:hypothetical protein
MKRMKPDMASQETNKGSKLWMRLLTAAFDALGAAFLGRARAGYEGEVAILWNLAADPAERGRYTGKGAQHPWQGATIPE